MIRDRVSFVVDAAHHGGIAVSHLSDHEEGRLGAFGCQRLENAAGMTRHRPVVEGQNDFPVVERQRLAILHRADARMLARVDHDGASDPERAGRALRRDRSAMDQGHHQQGGSEDRAHGLMLQRNSDAPRTNRKTVLREPGRGNFHGKAGGIPCPGGHRKEESAGALVPFPTFVSSRRTHFYERRKQRDTSKSLF